jgi:hypothetical protein
MLVGVPRFELGTSRTRTVRSTGLSHTPLSFPQGELACELYHPHMFWQAIRGSIRFPGYTHRIIHRSGHRPDEWSSVQTWAQTPYKESLFRIIVD